MNTSDTPIGDNGKKEIKKDRNTNNAKELKVKQVSKESLAENWSNFLAEQKDIDYGEPHLDYIIFDLPEEVLKDRVGDDSENIGKMDELQNIESASIQIVRPETFITAAKAPSKTPKNEKAYNRERDKARKEQESRVKSAAKLYKEKSVDNSEKDR